MLRFCLLLLISFCLISPSDAAYIVFRITNEKIATIDNKDEKIKVYKIIKENSWPNNIKNFKNADLNKLPEYITSNKPDSEKKYIEDTLQQEVSKDIHLIWVPTTFFQIESILKLSKPNSKLKNEKDLYDLYFEVNNFFIEDLIDPELRSIKYQELLNNALKSDNWNGYIQTLTEKTIKDFSNAGYEKEKIFEILIDEKHSSKTSSLLKEIYKIESMAYRKNLFPLYRATPKKIRYRGSGDSSKYVIDTSMVLGYQDTNGIDFIRQKNVSKAIGISIANTLFAGFYFDAGACTFKLFKAWNEQEEHSLYSLLVDKKDFLRKYQGILFWPQSDPIDDLFAQGEYFHPRAYGKLHAGSSLVEQYTPEKININEEYLKDYFNPEEEKQTLLKQKETIQLCRDLFLRNPDFSENKTGTIDDSDVDIILKSDQYKIAKEQGCGNFFARVALNHYDFDTNQLNKETLEESFNNLIQKNEEQSKNIGSYMEKKIKPLIEENKELELVLNTNDFLAKNMKILFDGNNHLVEHQVTETEHPKNEFYDNQVDLANLIHQKYLSGIATKKSGGLMKSIREFTKHEKKKN